MILAGRSPLAHGATVWRSQKTLIGWVALPKPVPAFHATLSTVLRIHSSSAIRAVPSSNLSAAPHRALVEAARDADTAATRRPPSPAELLGRGFEHRARPLMAGGQRRLPLLLARFFSESQDPSVSWHRP